MGRLAGFFRWILTSSLMFGVVTFIAARIVLLPFVGDRVCRDGWHSFSIGKQGACSWHGGVGGLDSGGWVGPLCLVLGVAAAFWRYGRNEKANKSDGLPHNPPSQPTPATASPPSVPETLSPQQLELFREEERRAKAAAGLAAYLAAEPERAAAREVVRRAERKERGKRRRRRW
jgi:hypothetical protein